MITSCWLTYRYQASHSIPECLWTSASLDAGWRPTLRSHGSWLAELAAHGRGLPDPFLIETLLLEGIMVDVLHAVDQGVSCRLIASIFVEIMALGHWGGNQAAQVAGLQVL